MANKGFIRQTIELIGFDLSDVLTAEQWRDISACKYLTENFIREFKDYVDWGRILCHQSLSEDFIKEFEDRVKIIA